MSQSEAQKMAEKQLGVVGKMVVGKDKPVQMKTIFIENKLITYKVTNVPPFFVKWFGKSTAPKTSKMRMIANGSTAGVSHYDGNDDEIVEMDVDDEQLQLSDYPDDQLVTRGNALARKILRRRIGGNVEIEVLEIRSVYRPYHVAFYGEMAEGKKVRYMPIAADKNIVRRTF